MNRRGKRDANHKEMTVFLRSIRWWYRECGHMAGLGFDILTKHKDGYPLMVEFKPDDVPSRTKLTESEAEVQKIFPQFFRVVKTVPELAAALGLS